MKLKNKYRIVTFIAASIICLVVIYLHLLSHERTRMIYLEQTEKTIIDLKKTYLKDTVNNIFLEIDNLRDAKYSAYKRNIDARQRRFQEESNLTDEEFIEFFTDRFNDDTYPAMWTAFLWDNRTGEILYNSSEVNLDINVENLKSILFSYAVIDKGSIEGIFGVSKAYIDEIVKEEAGELIRSRRFSNDSYIWVNEIINYEGGKNYAIRRIHPNLEETEGMYLSTDMEDIEGNLPYLEELEGIKKDGELFFTYNFKELNSSRISEKITYAKLYKDYNWVIAMGVHLEEIDAYTEKVIDEIYSLSSDAILKLLGYIFAVLLLGFAILFLLGKKQLLTSIKSLEKEINMDSLTKASSRRSGEISLTSLFKQFKQTGESPAIMMIDIDDYKRVNDKYGHHAGDLILTEIVRKIYRMIRSYDQLIRWGGDEFVGIFPGLREENIPEFGKKLLDRIASSEILAGDESINVTISAGFSYFRDTDNDYRDVLKRADKALYVSKETGKNTFNLLK